MSLARLGVTAELSTFIIDPANIDNLTKAIFCDNMYARLISYDDGTLKSWLAKSFKIKENKIYIELNENIFTSNGNKITTLDVEASLKRLLILDSNSHAKLDKFLVCSAKIERLTDACNSIAVIDSRNLILTAQSNPKAQMLLKILSSTEYGIVPIDSLDPKSLVLTGHKNTTGAFFLSEYEKGKFELLKNKYFISTYEYFDRIKIVFVDSSKRITDLFLNNEVDILPTTINLNKNSEILLDSSLYNIFYTDKIKLFMINFGPRMISEFSVQERHNITAHIRSLMNEKFTFPSETEPAVQFLSKNGSGRLTKSQLLQIEQIIIKSKEHLPSKNYTFHSYLGLEAGMAMLNDIPYIKVAFGDDFPPEKVFKDRPDSYYMMGDISFDEDYTLLSYYLTNQLVAFDKAQVASILNTFLNTESEEDRVQQLNSLHFQMIKDALVGPLAVAPYSIVTRHPFKSQQSKMSASTKLWLITKDE